MKCHPKGSISLGNVQNTDRSLTISEIGERFVKDQLIDIADQNTEQCEDDHSASNVGFSQPSTIEEHRRVKTLDGNERSQPIDQSSGRGKKIIQAFTQQIIPKQ